MTPSGVLEENPQEGRHGPREEPSALIKGATELEKRRTKVEDAVLEEVRPPDRAGAVIKGTDEEALEGSRPEADEFERRARETLSWSRSDAAGSVERPSPSQRRHPYLSVNARVKVDKEGNIDVRWPLGSIPPCEDGRSSGTGTGILTLHVLNPRR